MFQPFENWADQCAGQREEEVHGSRGRKEVVLFPVENRGHTGLSLFLTFLPPPTLSFPHPTLRLDSPALHQFFHLLTQYPISLFITFIAYCFSPQLGHKLNEVIDFFICSVMYLQLPGQWLAHSRCSINICWINNGDSFKLSYVHTKTSTQMFIAALFIIAKK